MKKFLIAVCLMLAACGQNRISTEAAARAFVAECTEGRDNISRLSWERQGQSFVMTCNRATK